MNDQDIIKRATVQKAIADIKSNKIDISPSVYLDKIEGRTCGCAVGALLYAYNKSAELDEDTGGYLEQIADALLHVFSYHEIETVEDMFMHSSSRDEAAAIAIFEMLLKNNCDVDKTFSDWVGYRRENRGLLLGRGERQVIK